MDVIVALLCLLSRQHYYILYSGVSVSDAASVNNTLTELTKKICVFYRKATRWTLNLQVSKIKMYSLFGYIST